VIEEYEWAFRFWDLISEGSMQCELCQKNDMFIIRVTKDTVIINFLHPSAMDFLEPFIKENLIQSKSTKEHVTEKKSIVLGLLGSLRAKKSEISIYMGMGQELATILYKHKKTLILQEKGRQLAKMGYGADSLGMRLLNLEHMEVNDLSALMRLLDKAKT
jgi:hypothetical protein